MIGGPVGDAGPILHVYTFGRQMLRATANDGGWTRRHVSAIEYTLALLWSARQRARVRRVATPAGGRIPKNGRGRAPHDPCAPRRAASPRGQKAGSWRTTGLGDFRRIASGRADLDPRAVVFNAVNPPHLLN